MAKSKIQLVFHNCPRCGKSTCGTNRPISGSSALHAKMAGICDSCATPEEKKEILDSQAQSIISAANTKQE